MKSLRYGLLIAGFAATSLHGALTARDIKAMTPAAIEAALPAEHPSSYYAYALRLFVAGKRDDAVFWYYVGQIRYRACLRANPQLDPSGEPALFAALTTTVGAPINTWAAGDQRMLFAQIDRALAWDEATANGFTSKEKFKKEYDEVRTGLIALRERMEKNLPALLEERRKAGLEIRAQ